jgi:hypothetical protein
MGKLFYSYRDGEVYILHKCCPLELLMDEQAGGDGLLIYASKELFEIVEYMDGKESGFTLVVNPKTSEPLSGIMFDMDKDVNEFFEYVSTVTGKKC